MHLGYVVALIWLMPPVTMTMIANVFKGHGIDYQPITAIEQGQKIKLAAIASEDQKFPDHYGIDVGAVKNAFKNNAKGKAISGGSTITQQTAKNVFLWQGRDWIRKGLEVYTTFVIEIIWGKEKILEHYLNIAEMGEGVYGVEAAAQYYFNTEPSKLNAKQAALLIASLPNPKKMNPNKITNQLSRRQAWILKQMNNLAGDKDIKEILAN